MKKIQLTDKEKMILERRGFYVKNYSTYLSYIKGIIAWQFLGVCIMFPVCSFLVAGNLDVSVIFKFIFLHIYFFYRFLTITFSYIRVGKSFITYREQKILRINSSSSKINAMMEEFEEKAKFVGKESKKEKITYLSLIGLIAFVFQCFGLIFFIYGTISGEHLIGFMIYYILFTICMVCIGITIVFLGRLFLNFINPLHAFGNLGEKIQSLTPDIEIESKGIIKELKNALDIDYKTLHHSFDRLSRTFEKIVSLVVRLEHIEKRANKGNLFDSVKYIRSLKDDILSPLDSLDIFLEEKVSALRAKEIELRQVRVKVGGSEQGGDTGHLSFTSTRIGPLITEIERQRSELALMREKIRAL